MRPQIDELRHCEMRESVGEETYRALLEQFCLDAAWILESFAGAHSEDGLGRCRHALSGLADNFGFPRFAELSRNSTQGQVARLSAELSEIRDRLYQSGPIPA